MSRENVEIVQQSYEAFDRGDYRSALEAFDPGVEFDLSHFPEGRVYHGHDGLREAFRIWLGTWEDYRQERDELIDAGDEVVVPIREHGRGKGSGVALTRVTFAVWTLRDGKTVRVRFYSTRGEALEALGVRE